MMTIKLLGQIPRLLRKLKAEFETGYTHHKFEALPGFLLLVVLTGFVGFFVFLLLCTFGLWPILIVVALLEAFDWVVTPRAAGNKDDA